MKLPFPIDLGKKVKKEYFLALLLKDESLYAVVTEEVMGKIRVIGEQEEPFSDTIETASSEELLDVADKAISQAENNLPEGVETHKTILGVKETWVDEARIKKEYLSKLKHLSDTLVLAPIGFIVIHEAIAHLLQKEEGAPVSAVLVEIGERVLTVSLLRAGRIIDTKKAKIEDSIAQTTDRILHHFTNFEVLPSRIILYSKQENESITQEFIKHSWSKTIPFLHVPQITELPHGFDAKAILYGAAIQMGFDALNVLDDESSKPVNKTEALKEETEEEEEKEDKKDIEPSFEGNDTLLLENFGFLKDKDVALSEKEVQEETKDDENDTKDSAESVTQPSFSIHSNSPPKKKSNIILPIIGKTLAPLLVLLKQIPKLGSNRKMFLGIVLVGLIILGLILFYLFGVKANVVVTLKPELVSQKQDITIASDKDSNFTGNIIKGDNVTISEDGTLSTDATGQKEVGEKAKGKVTIYSKLSSDQTFSQGTVITANNLQFSLDNDVKVASSSADASATPTTASVSVTASQVGTDSNVGSGTKFTVGSFDQSSVVAKNGSAFTGGTKKEITVVAKADQDKLLANITKALEDKATSDLQQKNKADTNLLPVFVQKTVGKKIFDKNVGDETKRVALKTSMTFLALSYNHNDLNSFAKQLLNYNPQNKTLAKDGLKIDIHDPKVKNDKEISASLTVNAYLLPQIDTEQQIKKIVGKSVNEAKDTLSSLPQVADVTVTFQPNIPFFPKKLPRLEKNISLITTQTQ